jgi:hypothetical protein
VFFHWADILRKFAAEIKGAMGEKLILFRKAALQNDLLIFEAFAASNSTTPMRAAYQKLIVTA